MTMRSGKFRPAAVLAMLAMGLQLVVGALGGGMCLDGPPVALAGDCESTCCERFGPIERIEAAASDAAGTGRAIPIDPDCCMMIGLDFVAATVDQPDLGGTHVLADGPGMMAVDSSGLLGAGSATAGARGPAWLARPPELRVVRTAILRI